MLINHNRVRQLLVACITSARIHKEMNSALRESEQLTMFLQITILSVPGITFAS